MDSEPDGERLSAARSRIARSQNHLLDTGLSKPADTVRDALQGFLGSELDVVRIAKAVAGCAERDADGKPVEKSERIGRVIAVFWNSSESVRAAINGIAAGVGPFDVSWRTSKFGMPNSFRQRELSILVQIQPTAMVLHDNLA